MIQSQEKEHPNRVQKLPLLGTSPVYYRQLVINSQVFSEAHRQQRNINLPSVSQQSNVILFEKLDMNSQGKDYIGKNFAFASSEVKLIKKTLEFNGFRQSKQNWHILWSNGAIRQQTYQTLMPHQKVNHFPRSHEITRKDSMFKNLAKMQQKFLNQYNFIPSTYILPWEYNQCIEAFQDPQSIWIVKPSGSSQGRGIFLTDRVEDLQDCNNHIVQQYISKPLLINNYKFDLRVYVLITCMNPLRIYVYNEGLVRFATKPYDKNAISSAYTHLTNYSINKHSKFFENTEENNSGSKWSIQGLKEYFQERGWNFASVWNSIKDIIVKTIVSIDHTVNTALRMYTTGNNNCFELLGFDVLIDQSFDVWLLEVNLSPSLNIDHQIDFNIKSKLIQEMFNLVGFTKVQTPSKQVIKKKFVRPAWNGFINQENQELNAKELAIIRQSNKELERCENFERVFPSESSSIYRKYFFEYSALNFLISGDISTYLRNRINFNTQSRSRINAYSQSMVHRKNRRNRSNVRSRVREYIFS